MEPDTVPQVDPQADEERLRRAFEAADAKLSQRTQQAGTQRRADKGILQKGVDLWQSAGAGIAKAGFETKDFVFGEPAEDQKSDLRRGIEQRGKELAEESGWNSLAMGTTQIVTGLIGAGKLMAPFKAVQKLQQAGKAGRAAVEVGRGAAAGATVIDPHEARLSDLIEQFPDLQNPVTEYLASDPTDSAAEGRFKNALEGIGADLALIGAIKVIKWWRAGNVEAAQKELSKLETARQANANEFGMDFTGGNQQIADDVIQPQAAPTAAPTAQVAPTGQSAKAGVQPIAKDEPVASPQAAADEGTIEQLGHKPQALDPKTGAPILPTDKVAPKVIRTKEITDDELASIIDGSRTDAHAIKTHGSLAAARANGHQFTATKLPWQKLYQKGGSAQLLQGTTRVLEARFNTAKGGAILHDSRVQALADDWADIFNEDPAEFIGVIAEAGKNASRMVAQMEAGLRVGNKMFLDASELAAKIRNGNLDEFGGDANAANETLKVRLGIAFDTLASANSIRANAGRAVRRSRTEFAFSKKDLERLKNMDTNQVTLLMERAGGDLRKASLILNEKWAARVFNNMNWHLVNGLLWMWPTHLVNVTTNAAMVILRPAEKLFGSKALQLITKDAAKRAELGTMAKQAKLEFTYTITSLSDAWSNAVQAFKAGDSILSPHNTEYFNKEITGVQTSAIPWKEVNSVWDLAQNAYMAATYRNIVGLPTRAMGTMDEAFKQMRYRAVVQARAAVEGSEAGLHGRDLEKYIQQAMTKAIDPASGAALDAHVLREAQTATFQRDLDYDTWVGSTGRGLQNLRKTDPKVALVLPFVKTPLNVIHYGIKMTPGLNLIQKEFMQALQGELGEEARAHAMGQMALGSMFMGLAAFLTNTGRFTGGGPSDPKLQKELVSTGWKPYSIVGTDEAGNKTYFQVGRFDPIGMAMGITADIANILQKDPEADVQDLILASGIALAKNLGEKSFLLNLNMAMEAALDPENLGAKWIGRTAGNMLPMSSLIRGHNPDPYLREARTMVDNAIRGVPGLSETLPITRDWLGQPVERYVGVVDSQEFDVVEAEHNRIILQTGKGIQKPSPQFEGVDLRDINLTQGEFAGRNAYEVLQELSGQLPGQQSLRERLKRTIESENYQEKADGDSQVFGTRLNALGLETQRYREAAKKFLKVKSVELQELVGHRQKEARAARQEKRRQEGRESAPMTFMEIPGVSPF